MVFNFLVRVNIGPEALGHSSNSSALELQSGDHPDDMRPLTAGTSIQIICNNIFTIGSSTKTG